MNSAIRRGWLAGSVLLTGMLVAGVVLTGCSPAPQQPAGPEGRAGPDVGGTPITAQPSPTEKDEAEAVPQVGPVELPEAPPVSTFASADDLVAQMQVFLEGLSKAVETEEAYKEAVSTGQIAQDSNTLILVALALGLHDSDNQFKAAAPAMVKAAQQSAAAEDYTSAKAAIEAVKAATTSTEGDPAKLKWEKVASLKELMLAVPLIDNRLRRPFRKGAERTKDAAKDLAGYSAVLAVIAQGSMPNSDESKKPDEVEKWFGYCAQMRDAAGAAGAAIRAFDKLGTTEAFEAAKAAVEKDLEKSCTDCHEVFKPD